MRGERSCGCKPVVGQRLGCVVAGLQVGFVQCRKRGGRDGGQGGKGPFDHLGDGQETDPALKKC